MDVPRPGTTQHRDTHDWSSVLSTPHWTVQFSEVSTPHWTVQFSEATWSSTTGSIITSQGTHWSKTARRTGPLQTSTNPPTYVNCTRRFIICNSNLHMSKTSCTTWRAIQREKGSDREWPERRKMSEEESETKKVYNLQLPPRQEAISFLLRKGESYI